MNKPLTRGQKARIVVISRDNAVSEAVDAPPMPHVVREDGLRCSLLRPHLAALELGKERGTQEGST